MVGTAINSHDSMQFNADTCWCPQIDAHPQPPAHYQCIHIDHASFIQHPTLSQPQRQLILHSPATLSPSKTFTSIFINLLFDTLVQRGGDKWRDVIQPKLKQSSERKAVVPTWIKPYPTQSIHTQTGFRNSHLLQWQWIHRCLQHRVVGVGYGATAGVRGDGFVSNDGEDFT